MPQFRLTKKFATDCKITSLEEPINTLSPLDDWLIDRMYIQRKKIAIIFHVKSTFTFFLPYADAGGAKAIPAYFKEQLKALFKKHSQQALAREVEELFTEDLTFTKTADRRILGYLNDFKRCATPYDLRPVDLLDTAEIINNMPVNAGSPDFWLPVERFNKLLNIQLPHKNLFRANCD